MLLSKTSTKSKIFAFFFSECSLRALPIDCIIICSDLKESANITLNIALIDTEKHIRGFYDATDSLEIIRVIQEINLLQAEYDYKNNIKSF